jgi:hypothetical protein
MFSRKRIVFAATLAVFAILLFTASITSAVECEKTYERCTSITTVIQVWPQPAPFCLKDHPIVRVTSSATCPYGNAGPATVDLCGYFDTPFVYSGGGYEHILHPSKEKRWEDVLWYGCDNLEYFAKRL